MYGVNIPQHVQGFDVVVAFNHRDKRPPPAAGQANIREGLANERIIVAGD